MDFRFHKKLEQLVLIEKVKTDASLKLHTIE